MATEPQIHKELELIQDIIKRMADNSFKVKAWFMAILSAVIALSKDVIFIAKDGTSVNNQAILGIGIFLLVIIISFWYLDGFFLRTEKLYRELYKWVVKFRPETDKYLYDLNTLERKVDGVTVNILKDVPSILGVMLSRTLVPFYLLPLLFVLGLFGYNCYLYN